MVFQRQARKIIVVPLALAMSVLPGSWAWSQSGQGIDTIKSTAPAVKSAADDTQGANSGGSGANSAMGQALMATGSKMMASSNPGTVAAGVALMAMGILAMMQSANQGSTAAGAGDISGLVDYGYTNPTIDNFNGGTGFDKDGLPTDEFTKNAGLTDAEATNLISTLKDAQSKGLSIDPKTGNIKLPNGKSVSPGDVTTPQSFSAASGYGLDSSQKAWDVMSKEAEKAMGDASMVAGMEVDEGGGGGGGGFGGSSSGGSDDGYGSGSGYGAASKENGERKLAGMSKNFNGEPIGVSSDNIFTMMTRRYLLKQKQNFFLREDEANR